MVRIDFIRKEAVVDNFKEMGFSDNLVGLLKGNGITVPTKIQNEVIPEILTGKNVLVSSATGAGKTLSFVLPMIKKLNNNSKDVQGLILAPTRELAIQITSVIKYFANSMDFGVIGIHGGVDVFAQMKKLNKGVSIVVATPGRLLDHIRRESIDLSKVKMLVVDEVDQMLLMGFSKDVDNVYRLLDKKVQFIGVSATLSPQVKKSSYRYCKTLTIIGNESYDRPKSYIKQEIAETTDRWKKDALITALREDNPYMAIIFCRTKRRADELYETMEEEGFDCRLIHSDIPQNKRQRIMKEFKTGNVQYLVATDVASRGLDISGVDNVYNYDVPESVEDYIHRIGRSGRKEDDGYALTFVVERHRGNMDKICEEMGEINLRKLK